MRGSVNLSKHEFREPARMSRRVLRGFDRVAFSQAVDGSGLSVSDIARGADVGTATIHAWKRGSATPQVDLLARVMGLLALPIELVVPIPPDARFPGDWRVIRGMTQPALAAAAGIATTTLRGIERADIALTDANADKLATLLDLEASAYRDAYTRARKRAPGTPV